MNNALLTVRNMSTAFRMEGKTIPIISDVSFEVGKGEILGIVGESGSGKSVTAKTILRILPSPPAQYQSGEVIMDGVDLTKLSEKKMREIRGRKISIIFQEPMTSLNPVFTCGEQIAEAVRAQNKHMRKREAQAFAVEMLRQVGIPMPEMRASAYPHELSGGMRQRVMIAIALSLNPSLLIADEPTTALDPTIQAQILECIRQLQRERGMSVMYITHDLGVVAELCSRVIVMYAGQIVEQAEIHELFNAPLHPYTRGLMQAMPRLDENREWLYTIDGHVPTFDQMPAGCHFCTRCIHATEVCTTMCPQLRACGNSHLVRCHYAGQL